MDLLTNPVKEYDWGSTTELAALLGLPPDRPRAEMWLGAHPAGPSTLIRDGHLRSLTDIIDADPVSELGVDTVNRFGTRLPFLLKLLAAQRALSLQVHPSAHEAQHRYTRDDPHYRDPWAKPEMVCALTTFTALAGLRTPERAAALLARLGLPQLAPVTAALAKSDTTTALATLLSWPRSERPQLVKAILDTASRLSHRDFALTAQLAQQYPGDPAVLAPLLMHHHRLSPGQAMFMPAGVLRTYLSGFAVEIMGASDTVLRAGLTNKPIDVTALLAIVDISAQPQYVTPDDAGTYRPACPEFRLHHIAATPRRLTGALPRVLLCTHGTVTVDTGPSLRAGQALFLPARPDPVTVSSEGTAYCAEPGI